MFKVMQHTQKIDFISLSSLKIVVIVFATLFLFYSVLNPTQDFKSNGGINMENEEQEFQGPVPEGYDEEHFRKTGETIPLKEVNGN
jgi:hypothetical protein